MRASEIQNCVVCGGHPLSSAGIPQITFYQVTIERAMVNIQAARETIGLAMYFGGVNSAPANMLAEMFSPRPHVVDLPEELKTVVHVCEMCAAKRGLHAFIPSDDPVGVLAEGGEGDEDGE